MHTHFNSASDRRAWKFILSRQLSMNPYKTEGLVPAITCFVKMQERTKEDVPMILRSMRRRQGVPILSEDDVILLTCLAAKSVFPESVRIGAFTQLSRSITAAASYVSYKDTLNLIPSEGQKATCRAFRGSEMRTYDFPYTKWMDFMTLYGSYFLSTHFAHGRDGQILRRNLRRNGAFLGDMGATTKMSYGEKENSRKDGEKTAEKTASKEKRIRLFHPDLGLTVTKPYLYATQDYLVLAHEATHYLQDEGMVPILFDTAAEAVATLALHIGGVEACMNDVAGHDESSLSKDRLDHYGKGTLIGKLAIGSSDPSGRMRELLEADEKRRKERYGLA